MATEVLPHLTWTWRTAEAGNMIPEITALVYARHKARVANDTAKMSALKQQINGRGWLIVDGFRAIGTDSLDDAQYDLTYQPDYKG